MKDLKMLFPNRMSRIFYAKRILFQSTKRNNTTNSTKNVNENISLTASNQVEYLKSKLFEAMSIYEEAIGLKEIKEAQQSVLDAEKRFIEAQKVRRELNTELLKSQQKLRSLRDEMDRLSRTDSRYLQLFTDEHALLKNESNLMNEYKIKENEERDLFFSLSASLRDSQEKERARVERIKYLQLGLSIACTTLGILSAFIYSYLRNSSINQILNYETVQFGDVKEMMSNVLTRQEQLELLIEKNHAILKDNISIIQNESLKLLSQLENSNNKNEDKKQLESNIIALIESALTESENTKEKDKQKSFVEEKVLEEKSNNVTNPVIETNNQNNVFSYLKQHTRELVVVTAAFLLGAFLLNK